MTGEVESAKKTGIYLMDETGHTIRIYIQEKTGIAWPDVEPGDIMQVTGILDKTSAGLRLLPQTVDDILVNKKPAAEESEAKILGAETSSGESIDLSDNKDVALPNNYLWPSLVLIAVIIIVVAIKYFLLLREKKR